MGLLRTTSGGKASRAAAGAPREGGASPSSMLPSPSSAGFERQVRRGVRVSLLAPGKSLTTPSPPFSFPPMHARTPPYPQASPFPAHLPSIVRQHSSGSLPMVGADSHHLSKSMGWRATAGDAGGAPSPLERRGSSGRCVPRVAFTHLQYMLAAPLLLRARRTLSRLSSTTHTHPTSTLLRGAATTG